MVGVPFSPKLRLRWRTSDYALSGVQMIFRVPPTFIPGIPSSHAGMTILLLTLHLEMYPTPIRSVNGTPI